jgi:transcription elongation GreA/GreB family factor
LAKVPDVVVVVGATVTVKNQDEKSYQYERSYQYTIVDPSEGDPSQGKISKCSILGLILLDKRIGDVAQVGSPYDIKLEILDID